MFSKKNMRIPPAQSISLAGSWFFCYSAMLCIVYSYEYYTRLRMTETKRLKRFTAHSLQLPYYDAYGNFLLIISSGKDGAEINTCLL